MESPVQTPLKAKRSILDDENLTEKLVATILSPIPGPSGLQNPSSYNPLDYQTPEKYQNQSSDESVDDDTMIQSFYDRTLMFDTSVFPDQTLSDEESHQTSIKEKIIICPKNAPPTVDDVQKSLFELHEARKPVYKDFNDVTKKRDVGGNVLHIAGDCLKACPAFESQLLGMNGSILNHVRQESYKDLTGSESCLPSMEKINEYLVTEDVVVLDSAKKPPSSHDAKRWISARQTMGKGDNAVERKIEDDSPAKMKVEKPINVILDVEGNSPDVSDVISSSHIGMEDSLAGKRKIEEKFQFNVSSPNPTTMISEEMKPSSSRPATPSTSRQHFSHMRRRQRGRLSLSKRLQIRNVLAASPDVCMLETGESPTISQTSYSSDQSNDTSEISNTSVSVSQENKKKTLT